MQFAHLLSPMLVVSVLACSPHEHDHLNTDTGMGTDTDADAELPLEYTFMGRNGTGSVSYSGQIMRQVLIDEMKSHLTSLTERIDSGTFFPSTGDVYDELDFYYNFDSDSSGTLDILMFTDPAVAQSIYDDVSSGKNLSGKIAGYDETGQHKDWTADFVGWDEDGVTTPESLVLFWINHIDSLAVDRANGIIPSDPDGNPIPDIYLTPEGQNLQQLLEKFLRGAIGFSQAADDYLDDDIDGKGLNADHASLDGDNDYTALEHGWDESFGYFGAARYYGSWNDDEIEAGYADVDNSGDIDLKSEYCFGHSVNAAKRDLGASESGPTDFTAEVWAGFAGGRAILDNAATTLTDDEYMALQDYRDQAVMAWEKTLSSSVVHYINEVLLDMGALGTADYSFSDHGKHWSEMKGFALSFQFNPRSPMSDTDFEILHGYFGVAPVLATAGDAALADYAADLLSARALLGATYDFDSANLGDDDGNNGW